MKDGKDVVTPGVPDRSDEGNRWSKRVNAKVPITCKGRMSPFFSQEVAARSAYLRFDRTDIQYAAEAPAKTRVEVSNAGGRARAWHLR